MKIDIINGPNLNLVGSREPEIYGSKSLSSYIDELQSVFPEHEILQVQSNIEGELVGYLQQSSADAIVLNAGAFTHTSIALRDAVSAIKTPVIELHISNTASREAFRAHSYISPVAAGIIMGFGLPGYRFAIQAALELTS